MELAKRRRELKEMAKEAQALEEAKQAEEEAKRKEALLHQHTQDWTDLGHIDKDSIENAPPLKPRRRRNAATPVTLNMRIVYALVHTQGRDIVPTHGSHGLSAQQKKDAKKSAGAGVTGYVQGIARCPASSSQVDSRHFTLLCVPLFIHPWL